MADRKRVSKPKSVKKAAAKRPAARGRSAPAVSKAKAKPRTAASKLSVDFKITDRAAAVESIMGRSESLHDFLSGTGW